MAPQSFRPNILISGGQPDFNRPLISSAGSLDPEFQKRLSDFYQSDSNRFQTTPSFNPIMQNFSDLVGDTDFSDRLQKDPYMQASLFDLDNLVKKQAGIYRKKEEGMVEFGVDADGQTLYALPEMQSLQDNFRIGQSQLEAAGKVLDDVGAFRSREEADQFANYTRLAGSPQFQGEIAGYVAQGNQKEAVNSILMRMGKPRLEALAKDPNDKAGIATAFSAQNLAANWDRMNAGQRSLALAGIALNGYRYATGENLTERVLISSKSPGDPNLTVGQAMGLAATGVNVSSLMQNWDQLDAIQRLTFGLGTVSQMATVANQFGLIGSAEFGSKAIGNATAQALGAAGFQAAPSAGVGAIVGPASSVPAGYTVVAAGYAPDTVVAVPRGHEGTVATMNGSNGITNLNNIQGGSLAAIGALQVYDNWARGGAEGAVNGVVGGTTLAQGLNQIGQTNPYLLGAIVALSAMGGVVGKGTASGVIAAGATTAAGYAAYQAATQAATQAGAQASTASALGGVAAGTLGAYGVYEGATNKNLNDEQKGKAVRDAIGSAVASYFTLGLSSVAQYADQEFFGGEGQEFINKAEKYIPGVKQTDKLVGKVFKSLGIGTGNEEHIARNQLRKSLVNSGFFDEDYNVTLANGQKAYAGFDRKDGRHEFRDISKVPPGNEIRSLQAFDVDYTNDLDFSANLMTTALMRVMSGGKGTAIDQIAGQLANMAISPVGYGQDMTAQTFAVAQANARSFFHQAGIKSKEDGYALANQAFAEQRLSEMDHMQVLQGLNMAFDEDGFETAQLLMAGRHRGIQVAHEMHPIAPVLTYKDVARPLPRFPGDQGDGTFIPGVDTSIIPKSLDDAFVRATVADAVRKNPSLLGFEFNRGTYGGNPTSGLYSTALREYVDPWIQQSGQNG